MKRSENDSIIEEAIAAAKQHGVALPKWAGWNPSQFVASAAGVFEQGLGWKVIDFGLGKFHQTGLVLLVVCNALFDEAGEPLTKTQRVSNREYPASSFSRKFLFVRPGQTEPHHFHRQKERKEVSVLAGGPVEFELAWGESDTALSKRDVHVQIDGIWKEIKADGFVSLSAGESITLPGNLSHIIRVPANASHTILLETSTANNDRKDNIFPFMTPSSTPLEEDAKPRYQLIGEHPVKV